MIELLAWLPWFRRWFGGAWRRHDRRELHIHVPAMSDAWLEAQNPERKR